MSKDILKEKNIELIHLHLKEERLYNNYASYCGLSLSSLYILYDLYALCKTDKSYMQSDIAKITSLSKQTVNSSIAGLIKKGYVELEHIEMTKNSKAVKLTKEGKNLCKKIIEPLIKAEENSLAKYVGSGNSHIVNTMDSLLHAVRQSHIVIIVITNFFYNVIASGSKASYFLDYLVNDLLDYDKSHCSN